MNYEKRYNELIDAIKEMMEANPHDEGLQNWVQDNVPELTENEDEKIRKQIISFLKEFEYDHYRNLDFSSWIAWLEKQGKKEVDPRYENLEELLVADNIYQMAMNEAMVEEAKSKAINALSELAISKLLGLENQGEQDTMETQSEEFDNNIITRDDEILQAISIGLTDVAEDAGWTDFGGLPIEEIQDWLEKQVSIDKEKMLIGARKDVASSIITYLDRNTLGMCLSNMECEDLVNAVVDSDWSKVYDYMKKKLEKPQGKAALEAINEEKTDNANKIEPKFKMGDWIIHHGTENIYQVVAVIDNQYQLRYGDNYTIQKCDEVDRNARLWNIYDAKPGDVLYYKSDNNIEYIVMNKGINMHDNIDSYFRYNSLDGFAVDVPAVLSAENDNITLATREQRDTLEMAITNAGYRWDKEKLKLEKI